MFFHYLVYEELLSQNPFEKLNVKFREPQVLPRIVPNTVIEIFLRTMYKQKTLARTTYEYNSILRDIAVIELLFATGVRVSELCSLTLSQIDFTTSLDNIITNLETAQNNSEEEWKLLKSLEWD